MGCVLYLRVARSQAGPLLELLRPERVEPSPELLWLHREVSASDELTRQIDHAVAFLEEHGGTLRSAIDAGAVGTLDFVIAGREGPLQSECFPARLVRPAGAAGLSLDLSIRWTADEDDHDR